MKTFNIFGETWKSERHTKWDSSRYDHAYFGEEGVTQKGDYVELTVVKRPLFFKNPSIYAIDAEEYKEGGAVVKKYCCGELVGELAKSYGTYTWNVKLPEGKHLWPALWLWGPTWPPEIDLIEGYTDDRGNYIKNLLSTRIESNFHMRDNFTKGTHKSLGAKGIYTLFYTLFHKEVDEYKVVWTPNYVKLYFNGHLFRTMKDKKFIADANERHMMNPIMNIMIDDGFVLDESNPPVFKIYDFKYKKL